MMSEELCKIFLRLHQDTLLLSKVLEFSISSALNIKCVLYQQKKQIASDKQVFLETS